MVSKFFACFLMLLLTACSDVSETLPSPEEALPTPNKPSTVAVSPAPPHQIALLLPLQGDLANAGKAIQAGFNDAYQQSTLKPVIKIYDTSQPGNIETLYDQAVREGANYIVGPLEKAKVAALEHHPISVITIALNNPEPPVFNTNLYEFALSPTDEVKQIADKAAQDGYSSALMITPTGNWGQNIAKVLQNRWQENNGTVAGTLTVNNSETQLSAQIQNLLTTQGKDANVIFMVVEPSLARQIKSLLTYYQEKTPVYGTSLIYTGLMNASKDQDLNGTQFCDMPLVLDPQGTWAEMRQKMTLTQSPTTQHYIRLYGLGFDAALLTQHFEQLTQGVKGSTGELTLDEHNDIVRKLNFAVFENGIPAPLN